MRTIAVVAIILISVIGVVAQTNKGALSGAVVDPNGAAVPGATVTVTNMGTGQKMTVTTGESGSFTVQSLEPVTYNILVEAKGFKKAVLDKVKVDTASTTPANVMLETGSISEQVVVTADAAMVNTESGTTSQTITSRQLQDVPLNNRSVLDLALTVPNVVGDAGSEDPGVSADQPVPGFNLSLNGGRAGSTAILADGVNNTGVGIARAVVSFTPETVQEFTVQTSAYSAEFGNTAGGVINATTKSGTNNFNGVALWQVPAARKPEACLRTFSMCSCPRASRLVTRCPSTFKTCKGSSFIESGRRTTRTSGRWWGIRPIPCRVTFSLGSEFSSRKIGKAEENCVARKRDCQDEIYFIVLCAIRAQRRLCSATAAARVDRFRHGTSGDSFV